MAQIYEKYWYITMAYTDIHSEKFIKTLGVIREFLSNHRTPYSTAMYNELQQRVRIVTGIEPASVRKAINQFVKLGFIRTCLKGCPPETDEFLAAKTSRRRADVFSRIVYKYANFDSSITNVGSDKHHMNFLIKTLEHVGRLDKYDIGALMMMDISGKECVSSRDELDQIKMGMDVGGFLGRKYNQLSHFRSILNNLEGLRFVDGSLFFQEDAERLFPHDERKNGRDMYLHRVYKEGLKQESIDKVGGIECMVEGIDYPVLVASHIKPFRHSEQNEKYDPFNGLLLTRSMDALFDHGHISFDDNGGIIHGYDFPDRTRAHLDEMKVREEFLTVERLAYMDYHRKHVLKLSGMQ